MKTVVVIGISGVSCQARGSSELEVFLDTIGENTWDHFLYFA